MRIGSDNIIIESNVDKGIYYFEDDAATGKTRLYQLIDILRLRGISVGYYNYAKYLDRVVVPTDNKSMLLYVVDRYDMYIGAISQELDKMSDTCLVLIDAKGDGANIKAPWKGTVSVEMRSPTHIILEDIFL